MIASTVNLKSGPKVVSKNWNDVPTENLRYYFNPWRNYLENPDVIKDYGPNNLTSTFVSPIWEDRYVNFNGINQYIQVGDTTSFNFLHQTKTWTVNFWMKGSNRNSRGFIIGNVAARANVGVLFILEYLAGGWGFNAARFECDRGDPSGSSTAIAGTTDDEMIRQDDRWIFLSYSPNNGVVGQWYVNSEPVITTVRIPIANTNGLAQSGANATRALRIGGINHSSPLFYNGDVGEVIMYDKIQTDQEIFELYSMTKNNYK